MSGVRKTIQFINYFKIDKKSTNLRFEIYKLCYDIYFKEMNRNLKYADHINENLADIHEFCFCIIISTICNKIIGTFRINLPENCDVGYYKDFYRLSSFTDSEIAIGARYIVLSDYRGNYISQKFREYTINFLKSINVKHLTIDYNSQAYGLFGNMGFIEYLREKSSHELEKVKIMKYSIN